MSLEGIDLYIPVYTSHSNIEDVTVGRSLSQLITEREGYDLAILSLTVLLVLSENVNLKF